MASGSALAMPTPNRPRPINPASGAFTSKAPLNPRPATTAPALNTPTDPKRETRRSPPAPQRHRTKEHAQADRTERLSCPQRVRDVYGRPVQARTLGQREAEG